jgi:hypothetical protein
MKKHICVTFVLLALFFLHEALVLAQDLETGEAPVEPGELIPSEQIPLEQSLPEQISAEQAPEEQVPEVPGFNLGTIPAELLRPQRGEETPRYPRDTVIGELGRGSASEESYGFARNVLQGALSLNRESALLAGADSALLEDLFAALEVIEALKYRIGGGREEPDGSTSFLFRFIGREQSLSGELYVRAGTPTEPAGEDVPDSQAAEVASTTHSLQNKAVGLEVSLRYALEDILLEEAKGLTEKGSSYPFSFSPYERFF